LFLLYPSLFDKNKTQAFGPRAPVSSSASSSASLSASSASFPSPSLFLARLVTFLMPYFLTLTEDFDLAQAEALETLASYGARTRSEMITAARIIAFSFSALDMLADAKVVEMSGALRLRHRNCASSLNRASQQSEKLLIKSLACDAPGATTAAPIKDIPNAEVELRLQHAQAQIDTTRNRLTSPAPQHPNQRQKGSAVFNAIADSLQPPRPA
jgi:hypothetical protein